MVTEVKYENQTLTYAGEEFYTTPQGARAMLKKYGLAIIPSILTEEECRKMNEGMWSTAEYLTSKMEMPVNRSDPSTYFSLVKLFPKVRTYLMDGMLSGSSSFDRSISDPFKMPNNAN